MRLESVAFQVNDILPYIFLPIIRGGNIIVKEVHLNESLLFFYRSAPEVILQGLYSHASDAWSFGVVAWELYAAFTNAVSSREQALPYFDLTHDEVMPYMYRELHGRVKKIAVVA